MMKTKVSLTILSFLLVFRCGPELKKKTLDFGSFSLAVPSEWDAFNIQGTDSQIGGITNGKDSLIFDYGWYSYGFEYENADAHYYSTDTINGKAAIILRPIQKGKGMLGIYIEKAKGNNRFNLIGMDLDNEKEVLEIFNSIRFHGSNSGGTSRNFAENYDPLTNQHRNEYLFDKKCSMCHSTGHDQIIGPGLSKMTKISFDSWMTHSTPLPDSSGIEHLEGSVMHRKLGKEISTEKLSRLRQQFK